MKQGKSLVVLAQELERQKATKRDYLVPTEAAAMFTVGDGVGLEFGNGELVTVGMNDVAHAQVAEHTGIPKAYYDKMRKEAPGLLVNNVNEWFRKYPATRMVRTLDGTARAFLSDRYRPLDNADLLEAALPPLLKAGVEIISCEVTERKLYLKVVDSRIKADLPKGVVLGQGHHQFRTVSPVLALSNSEVGWGAVALQTGVLEGGCSNLAIFKERSTRKYHIGARHEITGEEVYGMLSNETKALTDKALWAQIGDMTAAAFDKARFDATIDKLKVAAGEKIGNPVKVVELTAKRFGMNEAEQGGILRALIEGGDLTRYGLQAAVTRYSQEIEAYDRATEFETIGGSIIDLSKSEFSELAEAA